MSEVDDSKPRLRSLFDDRTYELDGEMTIGRHDDCNIVLDLEFGASRKHARFAVVDKDVFVTDLGSLNGTLVNAKEIESQAILSNGDILIFDKIEYEVLIPSKNEDPEIDPDRTIMFSSEDLAKQQLAILATQENDDWHIDVEAAAAKEAAALEAATSEAAQVDLESISEPTIIVQTGESAGTLL
jgi:hypothetical protein